MLSIGANISRKIININKNEISKEEFVALVEEHKLSLYRFAKSILKNDIEVEDAISESILKAVSYTHLDVYKRQIITLSPFSKKVCIRFASIGKTPKA